VESKRILIAAGGTGGHLIPGLALAGALKERRHEVRFVVRPGDIAIPLLKAQGFSFWTVHASGLPRTFSPGKALGSAIDAARGFCEAFSLLRSWPPRAIVGMGGHVSFPVVAAGKVLRVPTLLHEQNVVPGLTNRILAPWVKAVGISFPETQKNFRGKSTLVGNPVRDQFKNIPQASDARKTFGLEESRSTVLVFGGSLGAHAINEAVSLCLPHLSEIAQRLQFLHLAGPEDAAFIENAYRAHRIKAQVLRWTDQMVQAFAAADLVISRSGATTVAELIVMKKPAILIPYPHASENHQRENALILARQGWVDVINQKELESNALAALIKARLKNPLSGSPLHVPNPLEAASLLADLVEKVAG
jgi:UDP-N-acetylglucosamine--N-acetylmuramyl-(pentapeptide) pyrophosphoryl-undecaprenol N-acetylglucosamine transferase